MRESVCGGKAGGGEEGERGGVKSKKREVRSEL